MKNYFKNERGELTIGVALLLALLATALASGTLKVDTKVDLSKAKTGQAVYKVND